MVALENQLENSQRQYNEACLESERLKSESDGLNREVVTLTTAGGSEKMEHEEQVSLKLFNVATT